MFLRALRGEKNNPFGSSIISTQIFVVRHGHVADHQGDVAILPEGKRVAFDAGTRLANHIIDGATATILHAPTARTRETAEEIARGLASALRAQDGNDARVFSPRAEHAIRNFHFIVDGVMYPPTDRMHESLPASAERNPFLTGFWQAEQDPIAYWLTHPSEHTETPTAVAARLRTFFVPLLDSTSVGVYVLVTHSGPMRAFLRAVLGADPGEPDYCESFLVNADGVHYRGQRGKF